MKRPRWLRIVGPNKYELYASLTVLLVAFPFIFVLPVGYYDSLESSGTFSVALICVFNAMLDFERMNRFERAVIVPWFCFLLCATPYIIWNISPIEVFADR